MSPNSRITFHVSRITSMILAAYLAAALVAYLGYRARALSTGGAIAACLVGGTIFGFGGLAWAILLGFFFASSSALSFVKASDPRKQRAAETFEKGGRRDAAQVVANGGIAALLALLLPLSIDSVDFGRSPAWMVIYSAFIGALATTTADTWATEIGVLSDRQPRMISTGKLVPAGTSGGVTWLGTIAGTLGALCLGLLAAGLSAQPFFDSAYRTGQTLAITGAALMGGLVGSLADSYLGATVQASYWCPTCGKPTESPVHKCGTRTQLTRGLRWVNNDLVNLLATLVGAVVGGAIAVVV